MRRNRSRRSRRSRKAGGLGGFLETVLFPSYNGRPLAALQRSKMHCSALLYTLQHDIERLCTTVYCTAVHDMILQCCALP